MADFDPDTFLATKPKPQGFDPDAFLKSPTPEEIAAKQSELTRSNVPDIAAQQRARSERAEIDARQARSREEQRVIKENSETGVPLRTRKELDASLRARLSAEPDPAVQAKMLTDRGMPARLAKDKKNVIVRVKGDDGKDEDVLVHPFGDFTMGTVAGQAAPIAKTAANIGLAFVSPPAALRNVARPLLAQAATMGLGAGAVEGATTGGSRVLSGQPLGDTGGRALQEGAIEAALPLALNRAGALGTWTLNKLGGTGAAEGVTKRAALALDLPLTPSMARDSQVLRGSERFSGTPNFDEAQSKALFAARDKIQRPASTPVGPLAETTDADVAGRVQPIFARADDNASTAVRGAMTDAQRAAQSEMRSVLDSGIMPTSLKTPEGGAFIRETIAGKGPTSKASQLRKGDDELFSEVNRLATESGLEIQTTNLEKLAAELSGDEKRALMALTPGVSKIPLIANILTKGAAKPVSPEASALALAAGEAVEQPIPLTLSNARELRRTAFQMANDPGAPGTAGTTKDQLMRLYRALDSDMNESVAKSGDDALISANEAAELFHKTKVQPLQQSDVAKLFLETDAAGRLGDDEIISRLVSGRGNLDAMNAYRDVLGAGSAEYNLLRRLTVNSIADEARAGGEMINAGTFFNRLFGLNPGLQEEILGPLARTIRANTKLMQRVQGANIPLNELDDALAAAAIAGSRPNPFKNSAVKDVVYRGDTSASFDLPTTSKAGTSRPGFHGDGIYLSNEAGAAPYAKAGGSGGRITPMYVDIRNPADTVALESVKNAIGSGPAAQKAITAELKRRGYDGVVLRDARTGEISEIVAFSDSQIKRAGADLVVSNSGDVLRRGDNQAVQLLERAIAREADYQKEFMGTTQKMLRDGVLTPRTMGPPEEFVNRFIFDGKVGAGEVRQALTQIQAADPVAAEMLRRRTMARVLRDTRAEVKGGEASTEALNVPKLREYVENENINATIGKEGSDFLRQLLDYAYANEKRLTGFKGSSPTSPGDVIGRGAAAAMGHKISLARLAADAVASVPGAAFSKAADAFPTVRNYLLTGELPSLGAVAQKGLSQLGIKATKKETQGTALATAPAAVGTSRILSGTENERQGDELPLARK